MTQTYPIHYGTKRVTMSELERIYKPKMLPEMWRRLEAWLISEEGRIGIGSGWRSTSQQLKNWLKEPWRFARPGSSFHEYQDWKLRGGTIIKAYGAVDLVHTSGGRVHRSPTHAECESAKAYGLHVFISNEPWHMQVIETRSCSAWKRQGSPHPPVWDIPGYVPPTRPPIEPPPTQQEYTVNATAETIRQGSTGWHVERLQRLLPMYNIDVGNPDSQFGPRTDQGVRSFQNLKNLVVDGIVGPQTWGSLFG